MGCHEALQAAKGDGSSRGMLVTVRSDDKNIGASATINKWFKEALGIDKTSHSFRHALQDRMRAARVPEDIRKAILGHGSKTISDGYGLGHAWWCSGNTWIGLLLACSDCALVTMRHRVM